MNKTGKVVLILGGLAVAVVFFVIPTMWAMKSVVIWYAYWRYVDEVSNVSGMNRYLITAAGLLMFIPFWFGATMAFSIGSRQRRSVGTGILIGLAILYHLSLFWVTRETAFAFSGGASLKWYALTPAGVRVYDRPGVDPTYGIPLKPVTPEVVRTLELLKQGEFKPADPTRLTFFNPITGAAQAWYYRRPEGTLEFYDKPGFAPRTGDPLKPVTKEIILEWNKKREAVEEEARRRAMPAAQHASALPLPTTDTTFVVVARPGIPAEVIMPPNWQIVWWGDKARFNSHVVWHGKNKVRVFTARAGEESVEIKIHRYYDPDPNWWRR